jgi:thiol-disulfide isomerase/thioredoxin
MGLGALFGVSTLAQGQGVKKEPKPPTSSALAQAPPDESIKSINDDFARQSLMAERQRLERLGRLASRQNPADAAVTYEQLFRLAIAANMFRDAETAAGAVLRGGSPSPTVTALAHLVKLIAEADRGDYQQSLESLRRAVAENRKAQNGAPLAELPTEEVVGICDGYYQRLIHAGQLEIARKALQIVAGQTERPVLKEFLSGRLKRLELAGRPAPRIQGVDLDGKPFDSSAARGKVVLVVFWASWCLPCAAEIESLQQVAESYRGKGLQIVGINLDAMQEGGAKPETVMPNIRRFLLDRNVTWPNLINGQGDKDFAAAFGVTEIPANVLIAKDGTVAQIDLVRANLESTIARAVGD